MHPRTEELLQHLDANRAVLRAAVDGVAPTLRETRPAPDRWSVAEVLEHLSKVESQLTRLIESWLTEAQRTGALQPERDTSPVVPTIDNAILLDRSHRITAGERVLPRGEMDSASAWTALEAARARLRDVIGRFDGFALTAITHPHPVLGPLNGYQWLAFIGTHEARHARQIAEIG